MGQAPRKASSGAARGRCLCAFALFAFLTFLASIASAEDLGGRLDEAKQRLDRAEVRQGVQTEDLADLSRRIDSVTAKLGVLRTREAQAEEELDGVEDELSDAAVDLRIARERLRRMRGELRTQLVTFYKADQPSIAAFLLNAEGFDDLIGRSEYLSVIQERTQSAAAQISDLRDQRAEIVRTISEARDEMAGRAAELERAREAVQTRELDLERSRDLQRTLLAKTKERVGALSDDIGDLQEKVERELAAQQAALGTSPAVAAPGSSLSTSSGPMVWPVDGTLTSSFGSRWGRLHAGLDIAVPEGTPIRAASSGTVILLQSEAESGGYGNFTCVDHGGGLSTCYAHQSSFAVSPGQQVNQGQIIGASGNTGNSTGPHLHFETRLNGGAVDPMGYL